MRECGLLHAIDPSLPFSWLDASLYDDCESSLHLESNVVDDASLTDLEEVFDHVGTKKINMCQVIKII